jgi:hypothetical protein
MGKLSPLRRRMIEDMTVRNLSPATQAAYVRAVEKLSRYFGRSPDRLSLKDVRAFQVRLASQSNAGSPPGARLYRPPVPTILNAARRTGAARGGQ